MLWRSAQAAAKAGPAADANGVSQVTPEQAAAGSITPPGTARLQQLPQEYVALFMELLVLSMHPNAGVRGSAIPTLQSCVKRFPCLVELLVPELLAALAGTPGPLLGPGKGLGVGLGPGQAAAVAPGSGTGVQLPNQEVFNQFYEVTLLEAMKNQKADAAAATTAAGGGAAAAQPPAAAAAAAMLAAAAAKAAAAGSGNGSDAAAAKAAAAAALAAAASGAGATATAAAAAASGRSVAQESANDGRVAGACAVLIGCLDAWRVIFRDGLVFQGFLYALMASRCHSSNMCLKSIQMLIMQVSIGERSR